MKHKAIEEINTLSLQPESGRWVAVTQTRYHSGRKTRRKLFITALLIGGFFYLYNPMDSYQAINIQADAIELNSVEISLRAIDRQHS